MKNQRFQIISSGQVVATAATGARAMAAVWELQYASFIPPARRIPLDQPIFIRERCVCKGERHDPIFYNAAGQRIFEDFDVPEADRLAEINPGEKL